MSIPDKVRKTVLLAACFIVVCILLPRLSAQSKNIYIEEGEVKTYLKRAADYESTNHWREAIEQYQLAMKKYPDAVYELQTKRYVGVKNYFYQQMIKYPQELEIYRQMYDATSEALFEKALAANDDEILRRIVSEMFFASRGDDAANALAENMLEKGQAGEAFLYWDMIINLYPDSNLPKAVIYAQMASLAKFSGDGERYRDLVKLLDSNYADQKVWFGGKARLIPEIVKLIENLASTPEPVVDSETKWPTWGGNRAHNLSVDANPKNDIRLWTYRLNEKGGALPAVKTYPMMQPIMAKEQVFFNTGGTLLSVNVKSQKDKKYPMGSDIKMLSPYYNSAYRGTVEPLNWVFSCTERDGVLYANLLDIKSSGEQIMGRVAMPKAKLVAIKLDGFKYVWDTGVLIDEGKINDDLLKDINLFSPPIVYNKRVYTSGIKSNGMESQVYLFCFDAESGSLLWKRFICSGILNDSSGWGYSYEPPDMPTIAEAKGVIICLTNAGLVAALSADTGDIMWMMNYAADIKKIATAPADVVSYPVIYNNIAYVTPLNTNKLYGFDVFSGKQIGGSLADGSSGEGMYILGVTDEYLVTMEGNNKISYYTLKNSRFVVSYPLLEPVNGRGFVTENNIYLPTDKNLLRYNISKTKEKNSERMIPRHKLDDMREWKSNFDAGNILVVGSYVISTGHDRVNLFMDKTIYAKEFEMKIQNQSENIQLINDYVKMMVDNNQYTEAIGRLQQILQIISVKPEMKGSNLEKETCEKLGFLYYKQGNEPGESSAKIGYYRKALEYVTEKPVLTKVLLELGKHLQGKDALEIYQRAMYECTDQDYEMVLAPIGGEASTLQKIKKVKVWIYAADKIRQILRQDQKLSDAVKTDADKEYKKVNTRNRVELIEFIKRFPYSGQSSALFLSLIEEANKNKDASGLVAYARWALRTSINDKDSAKAANYLIDYYLNKKSYQSLCHFMKYLASDAPQAIIQVGKDKVKTSDYVNEHFGELRANIWENLPSFNLDNISSGFTTYYWKLNASEPVAEGLKKVSAAPFPIVSPRVYYDEDKIGIGEEYNNGLVYFQRAGLIEAWNLEKKEFRWVNYGVFHKLGISQFEETSEGLKIIHLIPGSSLNAAQVYDNDVLVEIESHPIKYVSDLIDGINNSLSGKKEEVKLSVLRGTAGKQEKVMISLKSDNLLLTAPNMNMGMRYWLTPARNILISGPNGVELIDGITGKTAWSRYFSNSLYDIQLGVERIYILTKENTLDPDKPDSLPPYINRLLCLSAADGSFLWEIAGKDNDAEPMALSGDESVLVRCFANRIEVIDTANGEIVHKDDIMSGIQPGVYESRSFATAFDKLYYLKPDSLVVFDIHKRVVVNYLPANKGQLLTGRWLSASGDFVSLSYRDVVQLFDTKSMTSELLQQKLDRLMVKSFGEEFHIRSVNPGDGLIYLWNTRAKKTSTNRTMIDMTMAILSSQDAQRKIKGMTLFSGTNTVELAGVDKQYMVVCSLLLNNKLKVNILNKNKGGGLISDKDFDIPNLPAWQNPVVVMDGRIFIITTDGLHIY
ncbi:MAG: hypothetical protein HY811_00475 [Planctomycetes bacterium]|nr:hypothetical protein [Planctomycetota bacterium]